MGLSTVIAQCGATFAVSSYCQKYRFLSNGKYSGPSSQTAMCQIKSLANACGKQSGMRCQLPGFDLSDRMSTGRFALCCQSGAEATFDTSTSARAKSSAPRSARTSPLSTARDTSVWVAALICLPEYSNNSVVAPSSIELSAGAIGDS